MSTVATSQIQIVEVDAENVGHPRNDGTPGSALYSVPIKLSGTPSLTWAQLFPRNWDQPPEWSNRHRPGIASVIGDRIILNGTTIEEVQDVHVKTLKLAVDLTNAQTAAYEAQQRAARTAEANQLADHKDKVRKVASGIRFN